MFWGVLWGVTWEGLCEVLSEVLSEVRPLAKWETTAGCVPADLLGRRLCRAVLGAVHDAHRENGDGMKGLIGEMKSKVRGRSQSEWIYSDVWCVTGS